MQEEGSCGQFFYCNKIRKEFRNVFDDLNGEYIRCVKCILGLRKSSSNIGSLVNMGWLPLTYRLALDALIFYVKISRGLVDKVLIEDYNRVRQDDILWKNNTFYRVSEQTIERLNTFLPLNLNIHNVKLDEVRNTIESAMFEELDVFLV